MTINLDPCPFCGGTVTIERVGNNRVSTVYQCDNCSCRLETSEEENHGVRWNQRSYSRISINSDHVTRLAEAIEGECDGLAIDERHAHAILTYVFDQPPETHLMGWQPIETAPTNGRDLILTNPDWNGDVMVGSFAFGKWRERPSPDGASMTPTHWMRIPPLRPGPPISPTGSGLTRLSIRIGGDGTPGGAYAFTEADDDGDYVFFTEAIAALSVQEERK